MMLRFIRKFGLEYCDLPTMMWNVAFLLRTVSLKINTDWYTSTPLICMALTAMAIASYVYVYQVSMYWFVFWRSREIADFLTAVIVFSQGIASAIGPVKLIYMFLHTAKIRQIVRTCLACDTLVVQGSRFAGNLRQTLRKVKRRAIIFWLIVMFNGIAYLIQPFLIPGKHLMDDKFMYYGLEPMFETPNYEIAMMVTMFAVLFTTYTTASISALVIVNVGYVEAQMLAWSEEVLHLWDDAKIYIKSTSSRMDVYTDPEFETKLMNEYVSKHLKDAIRGHARNFDLYRQIEDVFRGATAIEFFILVMGLIAELLGGLENTYMEVPFSFIQVAMDCLTGQRLVDANLVFEKAVFHSQWENFDQSNMKLVLLMLQSSQKTMALTAGGVAMLNFSCLMSVVRSIYSAYTTLRSTMM